MLYGTSVLNAIDFLGLINTAVWNAASKTTRKVFVKRAHFFPPCFDLPQTPKFQNKWGKF